MNKIQKIQERKRELRKAIERTQALKKQLKEAYIRLEHHYKKGALSYQEFKAIESETLKGKKLHEWMNYYDACIEHYKQQYTHHENKTRKEQTQTKSFIPLIGIILLVGFILFAALSTFTGFNIIETITGNNSEIALPENLTNASTNLITGETATGEEQPNETIQIEVPIGEMPPEIIINETINETIETPEAIVNETIVNQSIESIQENASISPVNETEKAYTIITENTTQTKARIGQPVIWTKRVELDAEAENVEIEIPTEGELLSIKEIENETEYDIENSFITLNESGILKEWSEENILTGYATAEREESPLKEWVKTIINFFKALGRTLTGLATGENPEESSTTIIIEQAVQEIIIEYTTDAPIAREQNTSEGKIITIESNISYENIETFTSIPETPLENIELYMLNNGARAKTPFTSLDTNADGLIDFIEWLSPESGSSFQIILIADAEHLDSNRTHIANIYEEVKEQDNNWSEPIYSGEYIRVRFEQNLTAVNDITVYVRNNQTLSTSIEVYSQNSTEKITEFPVIAEEGYYKVLLTNMSISSHTFDLRISSNEENKTAFLEFDHIIDPNTTIVRNGVADIAISPLSNTSYVVAWLNVSSGFVEYAIMNTTGAIIIGPNRITENGTGNQSRVALATINKTAFALAWTDNEGAAARDDMRIIINSSGVNLTHQLVTDGAVGQISDLALAQMSNQFAYCLSEAPEGDFDFWTYNSTDASTITSEVNIDATMLPQVTQLHNNILDCATINNTKIAMVWIRSASGAATTANITFSIRDQAGALPTGITDLRLDSSTNETSHVAVSAMENATVAVVWYNSEGQNLSLHIRNANNYLPVANITIDTSVGTSSRIATTALTNDTKGYVAIAYYDQAASQIIGVVYAEDGIKATGPFVIDTSPATNHSYRLMDAAGTERIGNGANPTENLCLGNWALAFTNSSNATVVKTYNINGSDWDGNCGTAAAEAAPTVTHVSLNDTRSIVEGGIRLVEFTAIINDTNGNINASSISANFSRSGEAARSNNSCVRITGDGTGANFSCTIGIEFYDDAGSWQVSVEATDNSSNTAQNNTRYFSLSETTSMNVSLTSLTFANSGPGARNITADNDPMTIQNTGNKDYLNFSITGINLLGDTSSGTSIPAANFTVRNLTGGTNPAYNECHNNSISGTSLVNNTAVNIEGANTSRSSLAQNNLYFCLIHAPSGLTTQTYSTGGTPNEDDWTITAS